MYSHDGGTLMGWKSQPDADDDSQQHNDTLFGFTDSNYAMDSDTHCSVSGTVFSLAGGVLALQAPIKCVSVLYRG